ncbi:MAG TPA: hypothetical protein VNO83_16115, partial [Pseudonocardia sp.]|nr:hypothetical protein [Pseudonocardia sp.]
MGHEERRCALDGCAEPIEDVVGRPQRLYCTPAHRQAARRMRRTVAQRARQDQLVQNLPWLQDTGSPPEAAPTESAPADPALVPASGQERGGGPEAVLASRAAAAEGRWRAEAAAASAGPGSSADPADRDDLPEWARHAGLVVGDGRALRLHGFPLGRSVARRLAAGAARLRGCEPPPPHRRAIAVIGAAGIVAGGYALGAPPDRPTTPPPAPAPLATSEDRWLARAQVSMTSVEQQLDTIERTEQAWRNRQPTGTPPASMRALRQRKAELQERRAELDARLRAVRQARQAREDVTRSQARTGEHRPPDVPPGRPPAAAPAPDRDALRERQQLSALETEAANAVRAPLPDDGERTRRLTDEVMSETGMREPAPPTPTTGAPDPSPERDGPDARSGAAGPGSAQAPTRTGPVTPPESAAPTETGSAQPTDSTQPTEPADSTGRTGPTEPARPTESAGSTEPTERTRPTEPARPTEPTKPTEPTVSPAPTGSTGPEAGGTGSVPGAGGRPTGKAERRAGRGSAPAGAPREQTRTERRPVDGAPATGAGTRSKRAEPRDTDVPAEKASAGDRAGQSRDRTGQASDRA